MLTLWGLLVLGLIFGLLIWLCGYLPAPAGKIARVVVVVIAIVYLLSLLGVVPIAGTAIR